MQRFHYAKTPLDDQLSSTILDQYLSNLDPNRSYFFRRDVEQFEALRSRFDDMLKNAQLEPAYAIFSVYRVRAHERIAYARKILQNGFNFEIDEKIQLDRSDKGWPKNANELNDIWRKKVKHDWLG